jgi:hypothetical protein
MVLLTVHNDIHGAKRMRKLTQRKAVDYTSTVVRYMQVMITALIIESLLSWKLHLRIFPLGNSWLI